MSAPTAIQLSQAIAQAIRDPNFRCSLLADPKQALRQSGISISDAQSVTVLESKSGEVFFVLPIPTDTEQQQLQAAIDAGLPQRALRAQVILRSWQDPDFKAQLFAAPGATLRSAGMKVPESTAITVLENSSEHLYLVLPHVH